MYVISGPCPDPGQIPNGRRIGFDPNSVVQTVTYQCNRCFIGGGSRTCQGTGVWSLPIPTCAGKYKAGLFIGQFNKTRDILVNHFCKTRMHSSRMRTAGLLPVSPSMHCSRGVYLPGGTCLGGVPDWEVYLPRVVYLPGGMYLPGGCTW